MTDRPGVNGEPRNPDIRFEHSDVSAAGVLWSGAALVLFLILCSAGLWGMALYLRSVEAAQKPSTQPLLTEERQREGYPLPNQPPPVPDPAKAPRSGQSGLPPLPPLEGIDVRGPDPRLGRPDLGNGRDQAREQEAFLNGPPGWVNRPAGVVRIPIEQAMDLVVKEVPARRGDVREEWLAGPGRASSGRVPVGGER
jgi:hypothetical protein